MFLKGANDWGRKWAEGGREASQKQPYGLGSDLSTIIRGGRYRCTDKGYFFPKFLFFALTYRTLGKSTLYLYICTYWEKGVKVWRCQQKTPFRAKNIALRQGKKGRLASSLSSAATRWPSSNQKWCRILV